MKDTNPGCSGQSRTHIQSASKANKQTASCPVSPRAGLLTHGRRLALLLHLGSLMERVMSCRTPKHGIRSRKAHKGRMPER